VTMGRNRLRFEQLESRRLLAADMTNSVNALDVNGSGQVTPLDVLLVISEINRNGIRVLPSTSSAAVVSAMVDVNADGKVSPIDALKIINALNKYTDPPAIAFQNASTTNPGSEFIGHTLPNTQVVIEQLAAVLPKRWTMTSDADGEFSVDIGSQSIVVKAAATDPLGRSINRNLEFAPGQPAPTLSNINEASEPAIGTRAPEVKLRNQNGELVSLSETLKSGPVVLYFYPKDNTPRCSIEASDFRDRSAEMKALGATVLGVSVDPIASHLVFANQYSLNFDILADDAQVVSKAYGVLSEFNGKPIALRTTFLIGTDGIIREVFRDVDVSVHGQRVIDALKELPKS